MGKNLTYKLFFVLLFLNGQVFADEKLYQNQQKIDSLLNVKTNKIYEYPDEAIEFGLTVHQNLNYSLQSRTKALMLIALGYTSKRDYQKALEYIIKANELSENLNDPVLQVEILFRIGILYQQLKIFDKSVEYLEKTERLALTYPKQDAVRRLLANSYIVKGFIYKDNLNCDIALEYFFRGIREYEKIKSVNNNANLSIVHYNIGNCYSMLSEYGNAKNSFNRSIAFAKLEKANSLISFAQKGLAEVYTLEGEYEKAIALLNEALNKSKDVGDLILNLGIYKGLFENYLALSQWENYQTYYDLYLKTQLKIKISERESVSSSIDENSKTFNDNLKSIEQKFKTQLKWMFTILIILALFIFFILQKNKKAILLLQDKIKQLQGSKEHQIVQET